MADPNRPEHRREPSNSDEMVKSLVDEYVASMREPIGSRNLFADEPDPSPRSPNDMRRPPLVDTGSAEPPTIAILVASVAGMLAAALAYLLSR